MAAQREWFEKDYYEILGVSSDASQKEITRAYRKLARESHPDANPGDTKAEERFKEISAAYDVVGDAAKRKEYDEVRTLGPMGGFGGPGGAGGGGFGPGGINLDFGSDGGLGDLLGGLFTRGTTARGNRGSAKRRGADLETDLFLSFDDAFKGVTTSVHLTSEAVCHTCHGRGAKPGTTPRTCPRCHGRGVLDDNQGLFSFSQPCPECAGRGMLIDEPCTTCHGAGTERRPREVKARVPAGVSDGTRIRLKGRGEPGANGGPAGDLYLTVHVAPHEIFAMSGRNLTLTVPVTFPEAALGADLTVPTLDGDPVTVRLAPGTPNRRTLRVKGRGAATPKGTGDLLVTIEVAVPAKLSAAERKAVEALDAATTQSPRAHLDDLLTRHEEAEV
jgi:molecular chaperone DnaJ